MLRRDCRSQLLVGRQAASGRGEWRGPPPPAVLRLPSVRRPLLSSIVPQEEPGTPSLGWTCVDSEPPCRPGAVRLATDGAGSTRQGPPGVIQLTCRAAVRDD